MYKIIVERRQDDYMAYLNGDKKLWGCGKTPDLAVISLIRNHAEKMNIKIKYTNPHNIHYPIES